MLSQNTYEYIEVEVKVEVNNENEKEQKEKLNYACEVWMKITQDQNQDWTKTKMFRGNQTKTKIQSYEKL